MLCLMTLHYLQHAYYARKGFSILIFFFNIIAVLITKKGKKSKFKGFILCYLEACSHQSVSVNMVSDKNDQGLHACVICFLFYTSTHFPHAHLVISSCHSQLVLKLILAVLAASLKTIAKQQAGSNSITQLDSRKRSVVFGPDLLLLDHL